MRLAISLLVLAAACQQTHIVPEPTAPAPEVAPLAQTAAYDWGQTFERIAVVGASSTAGFGLVSDGGAKARLSDFLNAAIEPEHAIVYDGGSELLFLNPEGLGTAQIAAAEAVGPTLLVGIDFLFWFFYGDGATTADRLARLEGGLALLERFDCPIVVGDLPYMIKAAGGMIPWSMMPDAEGFAPANARITEWAAAHDNVTLVALDAVHEQLESGGRYTSGSFAWDPAKQGPLLQGDALHPNMPGTGALAVEILAALAAHKKATLESVAGGTLEELVSEVDAKLNAF